MIRRTLEEICEDRGALGKNLQERLKKLRETVILPNELFEAANDLRLLGNDAAHIESKNFDEISEREVTISLMLTKEILKSLYQYRGLLDELKILKRENENK